MNQKPMVCVHGLTGCALLTKTSQEAQLGIVENYFLQNAPFLRSLFHWALDGDDYELTWFSYWEMLTNPARTFHKVMLQHHKKIGPNGEMVITTSDIPGVEVRVAEGLDAIASVNPGELFAVPVWRSLIRCFIDDCNLFAYNYDWRKWGDPEFDEAIVEEFRCEIEQAVALSAGQPTIVVSHSLGGNIVLYCCTRLGEAWTRRHIAANHMVAPAFTGTVKVMSGMAHSLGSMVSAPSIVDFSDEFLGRFQTFVSLVALFPQESVGGVECWPRDQVLIRTPETQYTIRDMERFCRDVAACGKEPWVNVPLIFNTTRKLMAECKPPAVPTHIYYDDTSPTPAEITFHHTGFRVRPFPSVVSQTIAGDLTIPAAAILEVAQAWADTGSEVYCYRIPNSGHVGIIAHSATLAVMEEVVGGGPLEEFRVRPRSGIGGWRTAAAGEAVASSRMSSLGGFMPGGALRTLLSKATTKLLQFAEEARQGPEGYTRISQ